MSYPLLRFVIRFVPAVLIAVFATASLSAPAHAGKRKVTTIEYDDHNNPIKVKVYDSVEAASELLSETKTTYDEYNNVTRRIQMAVEWDQDEDGLEDPARHTYSTITEAFAYTDPKWPTKVTVKYPPRFFNENAPASPTIIDPGGPIPQKPGQLNDQVQLRYAERFFYDDVTGNLELRYNSIPYCILEPDSSFQLVESVPVDNAYTPAGFAIANVDIQDYVRCDATIYEYGAPNAAGNFARPTRIRQSQMLFRHDSANVDLNASTWRETLLNYYPVESSQNGALRSTTVVGAIPTENRISHFDWDQFGNLTQTAQVLSPETYSGTLRNEDLLTTASYDELRRIEAIVLENQNNINNPSNGVNGERRFAYDPKGRLRDISDKIADGSWAVTHADYRDNGQIDQIIDPDGDVTSYSYDDLGRVDVSTDGAGRKTKIIYYANSQVKCTINGYGTPNALAYAMYDYAPDGLIRAQRPAKGINTVGNNPSDCSTANNQYDMVMTYDEYRRLYKTTYPKRDEDAGQTNPRTGQTYADENGHTFTAQLMNESGQIEEMRTRYGDVFSQYFDINGGTYRKDTPENFYYYISNGAGSQYWAEVRPDAGDGTYPSAGRRYVYSPVNFAGEATQEHVREGSGATLGTYLTTFVDYDVRGNLTEMKYRSGVRALYDYDDRNMISGITYQSGGSFGQNELAQMSYDLLGRRTRTTTGSPFVTPPLIAQESYAYDADNDLKRIDIQNTPYSGTKLTGLYSYKFDYDGSGKMTKANNGTSITIGFPPETFPTRTWKYAPGHDASTDYDPANKLDQYQGLLGNLFMENIEAGTAPPSNSHDVDFAYDGNGNLTSDGTGRTYAYNSENQLIEAIGNSFHVSYLYDGLGRRSHSIDHDNANDTETFHKHWGEMEVEDLDVNRAVNGKILDYIPLSRIILGSGVDERIAYHDVAGDEISFYHTNHQGSVVALTGVDGGWTGTHYIYGPYGSETGGAAVTGQPYRYTGRRFDAKTGLYYYRARMYSPELGRFLQTDPIGTADQMNLYNYVHSDPLNGIDPTGEACVSGSGTIGSGASALCKKPAPIFGNAQKTNGPNGPAHAKSSQALANRLSKIPGVKSVHLNQELKTISGGDIDSKLRPDVAVVAEGKNGKITITPFEVPSPSELRSPNAAKRLSTKFDGVIGDHGNTRLKPQKIFPGFSNLGPRGLANLKSNGRLSKGLTIGDAFALPLGIFADQLRTQQAILACSSGSPDVAIHCGGGI